MVSKNVYSVKPLALMHWNEIAEYRNLQILDYVSLHRGYWLNI